MTTKLTISTSLSLPPDAVTQTFAILAKRGVGKTYTASVLGEEILATGQQLIVLDPTGAWWGLRSSADGKSPGYPIVVVGGDRGDVPLEEHAGEILAQAIVENRFSAILDLSHFRKGQMTRLVATFLETLYRLNRQALHLIVDEADTFAPQRLFGEDARVCGAMEDVVKKGRIRGIGCTLITQRASVLNKNVLTQCESLFTLRMTHPKDIDAIQEWVGVHSTPDEAAEVIKSLPSLPVGEAWFWSPGWMQVLKRVKVRERRTFDSSATPKAGQAPRRPKQLAAVDLDALGAQIKSAAEQAKANDPRELRKKIAELERQLKDAQKAQPSPRPTIERVEVPVVTDKQIERLEKIATKYCYGRSEFVAALGDFSGILAKIGTRKDTNHPAIPANQNRPSVHKPAPVVNQTPTSVNNSPPTDSTLGKCERSILQVLSQHGPCEAGRLTLLAGYRFSGGFRNSLSKLRGLGLIGGDNSGQMSITATGEAHGPFDTLPRGESLRSYWLNHHSIGKCERAILEALIQLYPGGVDAESLCERTGYEFSGGFRNSLSKLRTAGLINGANTGIMSANKTLFE